MNYLLKVDLSDSENDFEEEGIDGDIGGAGGRPETTIAGGLSTG